MVSQTRISRIVTGLAAFLLSCALFTAAQAQTKPDAILILDASRSMWGQIESVNKIVSAQKSIASLMEEHEGNVNLGFIAFGHRQSSSCGDIQLIHGVGPYSSEKLVKNLKAIKPKGSTPIGTSLVRAANAGRYKERALNIVLVADGLDNCKTDPCKIAEDLKANGKDLSIHTIAFDAKNREKLTKLSCIPEKAGGTFHSATNEAELKASLDTIFKAILKPALPKLASAGPSAEAIVAAMPVANQPVEAPERRSDPIVTGTIAQAQPQQAAPQQGLASPSQSVPVTLSARTVESGSVIRSGLVWWIYKNEKQKDGSYQLLETFREPTPTAALPPGSYRIAAAYGKVNLIKDITVESGKAVQESFVLNAGGLRLSSVSINGTNLPQNSVRYDIFADESESDQYGNRKLVLRDAKPGLVIRLNAGAYHVVSTYGDANAIVRADVTVEPGRLTDATINHSAAKITLKLVTQPGGEALAGTQWNILTPGGDIVKESAGALPSHIIAPGDYSVLARHDGKNYTREFSVEPGETKQIEVVIQ